MACRRAALLALGAVIVAGHNLLDGLHFGVESALHVPWAILHDRGWLEFSENLRLRTSYPVLPWIGVIALGYGLGPWFARGSTAGQRQQPAAGWADCVAGLSCGACSTAMARRRGAVTLPSPKP